MGEPALPTEEDLSNGAGLAYEILRRIDADEDYEIRIAASALNLDDPSWLLASTLVHYIELATKRHDALAKISEIRDSIVGQQGFNFSEHAYPLVAVLNAAGFKGAGYEISRRNLGTLIDQRDAALTRAREAEAQLAAATEADGEPGSLARSRVRAWSRLQDLNRIHDIVRAARVAGADKVDVEALLDQIEHHAKQDERAAIAIPPAVPPPPARSQLACPGCGEHHLVDAFPPGARVVVDGKRGTVREWSQYGAPLYVRVDFDEPNAEGHPVRENYHPCQLSEEPF